MKSIIVFAALLFSTHLLSQDVNTIFKDAVNLEKSLKENDAYEKYKAIIVIEPNNLKALVKCSELTAGIGGRQTDKKIKMNWLDLSRNYAEKSLAVDSTNVEANYVRALVASKYAEAETENKKLALYLKEMKQYADKAVALNPENGKANYIAGKWHYDMVIMPWTKKAALKVLIGGIPPDNIDSAYIHLEKCRKAEPYFVSGFYILAKAYKFDEKPAKAIEVLNQLVKLPTRTIDDIALKAEGKTILSEMQ